MQMSKCGVICATDCRAYKVECEGCVELDGKVSWAEFYGSEHCPIHACVTDKGLADCCICGLAPCDVWISTRNPDASDAEFAADLANRLANLSKFSQKV